MGGKNPQRTALRNLVSVPDHLTDFDLDQVVQANFAAVSLTYKMENDSLQKTAFKGKI